MPDTVAAGARLTAKDVLEREIAVEIRLEIRLIDRQVELVPLAAVEHELVVAAAELHQAGKHRGQLRSVDGPAVASPEPDAEQGAKRGDEPHRHHRQRDIGQRGKAAVPLVELMNVETRGHSQGLVRIGNVSGG